MRLSELFRDTNQQIETEHDAVISSVSTDTRTLQPGALFVPLKGENVDGHDYIAAAFEKGAAAALCERDVENDTPGRVIIRVDDTLAALGGLAKRYLSHISPFVIGITGSVGKTTTKELCASVFGAAHPTHKNIGNFNTEIGVPLTIFGMGKDTRTVVLEMGMSRPGELARLSRIACPSCVIITNIGTAHIEFFGSQEKILEAKLEILEGLREGGAIILNGDDPLLAGMRKKLSEKNKNVIYYGIDCPFAEFRAIGATENRARTSFDIEHGNISVPVEISAAGRHNISNALAAFAAGSTAGLSIPDVQLGLRRYMNAPGRQDIYKKMGYDVIDDTYNASPDSMRAALGVLGAYKTAGSRIAALGCMRELGAFAAEAHRQIGRCAAENADMLFVTGDNAGDYIQGALEGGMQRQMIMEQDSAADIGRGLGRYARTGDVILFKGSRGYHMEEAIQEFFKSIEV